MKISKQQIYGSQKIVKDFQYFGNYLRIGQYGGDLVFQRFDLDLQKWINYEFTTPSFIQFSIDGTVWKDNWVNNSGYIRISQDSKKTWTPPIFVESILVKTINEWFDQNTVLKDGQIGMERYSGKYKIGDGTSRWVNLPYTIVSQQAVPWKREIITLTSTHISNKGFDVSEPILFTETVVFTADCGVTGILNEDFSINQPNTISWSGKEWDMILEENDVVQILYK